MNVFKIFSIIYTLLFVPSLVNAFPIPITDIEVVEEKVRTLRKAGVPSQDIAVILDFHGVITDQKEHKDHLTKKGKIVQFMEYLSDEKICLIVGTAWNKFDQIKKGIDDLGLSKLLEIDPDKVTEERVYKLGREPYDLQGYVEGRVTALRYVESREPWYRQKAFCLDAKDENQNFTHVIFVDDDLHNHAIFEVDFKKTHIAERKPELLQYHLKDAPKEAPKIIGRQTSDVEEDSDSMDIKRYARSIHSSGEGEIRQTLVNSSDNLKDSR